MKKISYKKYLFIALIFSTACSVYAQDNDSLFYFSGKIISEEGKYPVALAHVINLDQHWGVVADTSGYFEIWVNQGDTLHFSAIGFYYLEYPIEEFAKDSLVQISLQNRYYEIPEVSITYLGTYKDFEYKVLNLELPETGINPGLEKLFKHVEFPLVAKPVITSPASLIYSLFSKEAKEIKKYFDVIENQDAVQKFNQRYNVHIIRNLTGLSGVEAHKFMDFCNFQEMYVLSISDYNLYSEIMLRFEAYKKNMNDSEKHE
ncbi:MAG: carboxypeptidase-like regulatory domain-containing protein [Bacteroidales bacterium]|nr:carboxypeptidase-like regulatory domain-containing protein [Bacteroidales bacterium]